MSGASRRRSTSEGGGGLLSSALNLPVYAQTNRLPEINPKRFASTPHINTSGFIDDKYWDHKGMHLESRIRTRSKGGSSFSDKRFGDDFIRLGNEISDWGQIVLTYAQTADVIKRQYDVFYMEIEQMEAGGGLNLVDECGFLRVALNEFRRLANQLTAARARPDVSHNLDTKDEPTGLSCSQMVSNSQDLSCSQMVSNSQDLSCSEELSCSQMKNCPVPRWYSVPRSCHAPKNCPVPRYYPVPKNFPIPKNCPVLKICPVPRSCPIPKSCPVPRE